jgi:hypothetical protein
MNYSHQHSTKKSVLVLALWLLFGKDVQAVNAFNPETDPYCIMYRSRLEANRASLLVAKAEAIHAARTYKISKKLQEHNAMPQVDFLNDRMNYKKWEIQVLRQDLIVREYELLTKLVTFIRSSGREVPLLP